MNKVENLTKIAKEIIVDIAVTELGEPTYVIDHDDLKEYIVDNLYDEPDLDELVALIPEVDLKKFNDELISEIEDELINRAVCRADYAF